MRIASDSLLSVRSTLRSRSSSILRGNYQSDTQTIGKGHALVVFADLRSHQPGLLSNRAQCTRDRVDRLVLLLEHHLPHACQLYVVREIEEDLDTCCSCRAHSAWWSSSLGSRSAPENGERAFDLFGVAGSTFYIHEVRTSEELEGWWLTLSLGWCLSTSARIF